MASEITEADDEYPSAFAGSTKHPLGISGQTRWDNFLQADIFEIVIGPFKTKELLEKYAAKLSDH